METLPGRLQTVVVPCLDGRKS